jgi:hypothetical protein
MATGKVYGRSRRTAWTARTHGSATAAATSHG